MADHQRADRDGWAGGLFRLLVENVRDYAIFAVSGDGVILTWSRGAERLLGYREDEAVGQPVDLFFTPEDCRDGVPGREMREALETGRGVDDRWHVRKDGSRFWTSGVITPLRDEAGGLRGFAKIMRDRTDWWYAEQDRREAEERLRREREWLRVTLASIGDAVIATDLSGRVTLLNAAAEALTGWRPGEAEGAPLEDVFRIVNEQTRDPAESPPARALREGAVVGRSNHNVLIARDGTERAIDDSAAPIRDETGGVTGAVLVFRDVGEDRKVARALEASEARKAAVLETALDAIVTIDHEGRVVEWNPAAEATFGYDRAAASGREMCELIVPPALRADHRRGMARYLATGEGPVLGRRIEITAVRADGTEFPIELAITRIPLGGPPMFTAHIRDITDRRAAERRRDARLAATQILADAASPEVAAARVLQAVCEALGWDFGALWVIDEPSGVLRCLDLWHRPAVVLGEFEAECRVREIPPGVGLPGRVWESGRPAWIPDVTRDPNFPRGAIAAREGLHAALAAPVTVGGRFLGVVEFISTRVRDPDADLLETLATLGAQVGQFLERKRAEAGLHEANRRKDELLASLRDSEGRFRTVAESIPQLAWTARPDGYIDWYNRRWHDYTDTTPEEMEGWGWQKVHDPEVLPAVMERWCGSIARGEPFDMVFPLKGADGRFRPFLTRVMPVRGDDGRVAQWFGTNTDISDRLRIEEELRASKEDAEQANRAKTQFLAVLSHELRTPLNPILLAATAMLKSTFDPREIRPTLEMIRQNVHLQARLIDDLLDVMRIVRGKMVLHREVVDGHRLIEQAVQICRSEVFGGDLRLEVSLGATRRHVDADPARLQQVFWNLIKNAVKFTPGGGTVAVRTYDDPVLKDRFVVEVSDTGIGIAPDVLLRIFDPFQQGETTITRRYGGLGLGLAICKGIVEAHGGTITAESPGEGRGTTFRVLLPSLPVPDDAGGAGAPGHASADAPGAAPVRRILVVEDDPTTLRLMARLLRGLGHVVTTAGTIAAAREAFEAGAFDLIVSDIGLPDGTGLDLMRRVVAVRGAFPSIALTGYGMEDDVARSRDAGFTAHMTKPIDFARLEATIRRLAT